MKDTDIYGIIYAWVMKSKEIEIGPKALYALLCTYREASNNTCFPGDSKLAEQLMVDIRTIRRYMLALQQARIIERITLFDPHSGKKKRTILLTDIVKFKEKA